MTVVSTVLLLIQGIIPLVILYIFKLIVDYLTASGELLDAGGVFGELVPLLGIGLAISVVGNLCAAALSHINVIQSHLVADRMQQTVQEKSIEMDLAYYENTQFYDKLHRAQREAPSRPVRIVQGLTQLARNSLTLLGAFALLLTFHWGVVVAIFVASLPILFYRLKQAEAVYALHREKTESERLSTYLNRVITTGDNAKEVRIFGFGPIMAKRFREIRHKLRSSLRKISAQGAKRQFVTESTAATAGYGALAFIAYAAVTNAITLGDLVMYVGAFQVALGSLRPTLGGLAELYENNLFLSALYEFLDVPRTIAEPTEPRQMPRPWHFGVRVENLSFRYPGTDRMVLEQIDMEIRPGEIIALVGRNGSGKTTLTKLLCRLYDSSAGRITIDGIDLREFTSEDLRREIGAIFQDYGRYQITAKENIAIGCPNLDPNDPVVEASAKWAGIHEDLIRLPRGYDTVLSRALTDGEELSIGQWQKLALARALQKDAQLILLDEPTSSLDPGAEFEFFESFRDMIKRRSALIISHRFSTVRLADRIYVLDEGRLVEQGDHETLLARDELYAHLYIKQASFYQDIRANAENKHRSCVNADGLG